MTRDDASGHGAVVPWPHHVAQSPAVMANVLMIVSRDNPALYSYAVRQFEGLTDEIDIILDRRHGERRLGGPPVGGERRQGDRRAWAVDRDLRSLGWALVRRDLDGRWRAAHGVGA